MTALDATIETASGDLIPATAMSAGRKLPASSIVVDGAPVSADGNEMPVAGTLTLTSDQYTALLGAIEAVTTSLGDILGEVGSATTEDGMVIDATPLTALTASPGGAIGNLTDAMAAVNAHVAALHTEAAGAAVVGWTTTGSVHHYKDRDRVWFGGVLEVANAGSSTVLATLPSGSRPTDDVVAQVWVWNDLDGTPAVVQATLILASTGVLQLGAVDVTLVGRCNMIADGVSVRLTAS